MINEIKGNALNVECDVLAHQTNYFGVMGGGIAFQIRKQLLSKQNFDDYQKYCNELKSFQINNYIFLLHNLYILAFYQQIYM